MKKDKSFIELSLRAFKNDNISLEQATQGILTMYKKTYMFNYHNFSLGFYIGLIIGSTIIKLFVK